MNAVAIVATMNAVAIVAATNAVAMTHIAAVAIVATMNAVAITHVVAVAIVAAMNAVALVLIALNYVLTTAWLGLIELLLFIYWVDIYSGQKIIGHSSTQS